VAIQKNRAPKRPILFPGTWPEFLPIKPSYKNQAIALMAAARRLLWRAALFLWMMFLSATRSMTLEALRKTSLAAAWSPAAMAWRTRLMEVRIMERRLALCLLRATD